MGPSVTLLQDSKCRLVLGNSLSMLPCRVSPSAHLWEVSQFPSINSLTTVHSFCFSSPFKIKVLPAHDASKVRASGPGLNASGIPASLPVEFTIDARDAGEGLLTVQILVSLGTASCPAQPDSVDIGRPDLSSSSRIPRVNPRRPTSETMGTAHIPYPTCQT